MNDDDDDDDDIDQEKFQQVYQRPIIFQAWIIVNLMIFYFKIECHL